MSWVIKSDVGNYLHSWVIGLYCCIERPEWDGRQLFAHRFTDRNYALVTARKLERAGATIVRLRKRTTHQVCVSPEGK